MSWSTGYTKYLDQKAEAEKVIAFVKNLGISIGSAVIYENKTYKVKQLWISNMGYDKDKTYLVRAELEGREDYMVDLKDLIYGKATGILYSESTNVTT